MLRTTPQKISCTPSSFGAPQAVLHHFLELQELVDLEKITHHDTYFIQKNVWLQQADFKKLVAKNSSIGLLGYTLIDSEKEIGKIEEVIEQPHQVLLQINVEGKEALVPLHEETLVKIDHKKYEVHVILPEGLLDVYLK